MDPVMATAASADESEAQDNPQEAAQDSSTDKGPLESIRIDPAENGGYIATHDPKASKRVKTAEFESMRPRKHAIKNHKDLMKHLEHHTKRLKA